MEGSSESVSFEPEVQLRERTRERREVEKEVEQSLRMSRKFDKSSSFATDNSCARCGKNVFAIERFQAEGLVFHSGCFTCQSCPTNLTSADYHQHENRFYCTQHYLGATKGMAARSPTIGTPRSEETPSESCTACGRRVIHFEKIEVDGKLYHRPCFACKTCKKPLDMDTYEEIEGEFFCPLHFVEKKQRSPKKPSKKEEKKAKREEKKAKRGSVPGSPSPQRLYGASEPADEASSVGKKSSSPLFGRKGSSKAEAPEAGSGEKKKKRGLLKQLSRGRKENRDAVRELEAKEKASKASVVEALNAAEAGAVPTRSASAKASVASDVVDSLPVRSLSAKSSDDSSKDTIDDPRDRAPEELPVIAEPASLEPGAPESDQPTPPQSKDIGAVDVEGVASGAAVDVSPRDDAAPPDDVSARFDAEVAPKAENAPRGATKDELEAASSKLEIANGGEAGFQGENHVDAAVELPNGPEEGQLQQVEAPQDNASSPAAESREDDEKDQDGAAVIPMEGLPEMDGSQSEEHQGDAQGGEDGPNEEPHSSEGHHDKHPSEGSLAPQEHTGELSAERSAADQNTFSGTATAEDGTEASGSDASSRKRKSSKKGKKKDKKTEGGRERSDSLGSEKPKLKKGRSKLRFRVFRKKKEEEAVPKSKSSAAVLVKSKKEKKEKVKKEKKKPKKEKKEKKAKKEKKSKKEKKDNKKHRKDSKEPEDAQDVPIAADVPAEDHSDDVAPKPADEHSSQDEDNGRGAAVVAEEEVGAGVSAPVALGHTSDASEESQKQDDVADDRGMEQSAEAGAPPNTEQHGEHPKEEISQEGKSAPVDNESAPVAEDDQQAEESVVVEESAEPAVEPAVEPAAEPAVEPAAEPAVEPAVEPAAGPAVGPAADEAAIANKAAEPAEGSAVAEGISLDAGALGGQGSSTQHAPDADSDEGMARAISGEEGPGAGKAEESEHTGEQSFEGQQDLAPAPDTDGTLSKGELDSEEERLQHDGTKRRRSLVHTFTNLFMGNKAEDSHALKSPRGGRTKRKKGKHISGDRKASEDGSGLGSDGSGVGSEDAPMSGDGTPEPKRKGRSRMKYLLSSKSSKMKDDLRRNQTVASVEHTSDSPAPLPAAQSTSSLGSLAKKLRRSKKDLKKNQLDEVVPVPARMKSDMTVRTKEVPKLTKKERKAIEKEEKAAAKAEKAQRLAREKAEKAAAKAGVASAPARRPSAIAAAKAATTATGTDDKTSISSDRGEGERDDCVGGDTDPDVPDVDDAEDHETSICRDRGASTIQEQIAQEGESASSTLEGENAKALLAMKKAEETQPRSPFVPFAGNVARPAAIVKPMPLPTCSATEVDAAAAMDDSDEDGEQELAPKEPPYGLEASLAKRKQEKLARLAALSPEERVKHDILKKGYFEEKTFKIGVLGLSNRLFCLLSALFSSYPRRIDLVAIYETETAMLKRAQERFGEEVVNVSTVDDLVSKTEVEWVLVGSLPMDHCKHIVAAFNAGKHVFCEKPLGLTIKDVTEIYRAYKLSGCHFVTGHVQRSNPFYEDIFMLVQEGAIGKVVSVEANETLQPGEGGFFMGSASGLRSKTGPPLLDRQHDLDIISWIVNSSPARVAAFGGLSIFTPDNRPSQEDVVVYTEWENRPANVPAVDPFTSEKDVEDNQVVIIEFFNSVRATFHSNFNSALPQRRLLICGLKGTIEGDLLTGTVRFKTIEAGSEVRVRQHTPGAAHGGGDQRLMDTLVSVMSAKSPEAATALSCVAPQQSLVSCLTALSVDKARAERMVVELASLGVDFRSLGVSLESAYKQ